MSRVRIFLIPLFLVVCFGGCQLRNHDSASRANGKVKVFILSGQSNMTGRGTLSYNHLSVEKQPRSTLLGLATSPEHREKYAFLREGELRTEDGWRLRDDVFITTGEWPHVKKGEEGYDPGKKHGPLGPYFGGRGNRGFGPEWAIGHHLGDYYEDPVLLVKVAFGNNGLARHFRPPSSGGETGPRYPMILKAVEDALKHLPELIPNYSDRPGYELVGFFWNQGLSDLSYKSSGEYKVNLENLIKDLRKDLKTPQLKVSVAITGNWGWGKKNYREHLEEYATGRKIPIEKFMKDRGDEFLDSLIAVRRAQESVAEIPAFRRNVNYAETRDFWRPGKEFGGHGTWQHWSANAESYWLIGDSMGKAMLRLLSL